jgi:uncharacterized membrane protein YozB (DUF420 family)
MASPSPREILLAKFNICTCSAALLERSSLLCALHVLPHGAHTSHDRRVLQALQFTLFRHFLFCYLLFTTAGLAFLFC